jgi:hypothetical protein
MPDKILARLCLLIAVVATIGHSLWLDPWMLDDAFIFFRYAENWAAGHGPLFNVGEPPVEGFTSFLWLAVLTIGEALGADLPLFSILAGHVASLAVLVLLHQSHRMVECIDQRSAAFATLLVGTCGAFTPSAQSGMETSLHAALVTGMLLVHMWAKDRSIADGFKAKRFIGLGLLCSAAAMNRPDALLLVGVLAIDGLFATRRLGWRGFCVTLATFVFVFGTYYVWRYSYFGYPVPNTFYAKVGASSAQVSRGVGYLVEALVIFAPMLLLIGLVGRKRLFAGRSALLLPLVLLLAHCVYVTAVGGDVMPAFRFLTPETSLVALLAGVAIRQIERAASQLLLLGATAMFGVWGICYPINQAIAPDVVALNGRIVGEWLQQHAPRGSVVATNTAGTVVYYSKLRAIDMLGLNDLHIAHQAMPDMGTGFAGHEKGDGDYVLSRNPEFIHLGSAVGWAQTKHTPVPPFRGGQEIWANPEFKERYKLFYTEGDTVWPSGDPLGVFGFWVRNDVYEALKSGG